jgi:hypothetical protein
MALMSFFSERNFVFSRIANTIVNMNKNGRIMLVKNSDPKIKFAILPLLQNLTKQNFFF